MTVFEEVNHLYDSYRDKYGVAPTQITMTRDYYDKLTGELAHLLVKQCEQPQPPSIMGMEIIIRD